METLKKLYRIGTGPSSSHTMAPARAARRFIDRYPAAAHYRVTLFASLAATGKGHLTDQPIEETIAPTCGACGALPADWQKRIKTGGYCLL